MSPRPYRQKRRAEAQLETRKRILDATVELHADQGALGTSYAQIADMAGVSTQTVYNHFPDLGELVGGCTAHVAAQAPELDAGCFEAADDAAERLERLAAAVYRQLEFMAPWLRLGLGESEHIPELAAVFEREQKTLRSLLRQAVASEYRATPEFLDAALALLSYPSWKILTNSRSRAKAATLAARCLVALLPELAQPHQGDKI